MRETRVQSLGQEDPLEKDMAPTPVLLPGDSHGWRILVGYSPWGPKESETTERLHFHHIFGTASSNPAFLDMYSAYKLNKQGDNMQP